MQIAVAFAIMLAFVFGLTFMELWNGIVAPPIDPDEASANLAVGSGNNTDGAVGNLRNRDIGGDAKMLSKPASKTGGGQGSTTKTSPVTAAPHSVQLKPERTTPLCPYTFKVYVYPLPNTLGAVTHGAGARRNKTLHVCQKCILEQFALEYIVEDFFINTCARTANPEEADFFYLPLLRDAEFRTNFPKRAPSLAEQALLLLLEKNDSSVFVKTFGVTDAYWRRHDGADHVIVMPAPVTNLRHESSRRGFFHYTKHLLRPIFVAVEYSKGFVDTFPICTRQKNILVPYPTTDPDLFSGHLYSKKIERKSLLYYAGGVHGDCVQIRKAMKFLILNSTALPNVVAPIPSNMREREHGFAAAIFCPIPVGDSPSSKRMYDVLNFGCIPVVVSDDLVWAYSEDVGGWLQPTHFALQIPQIIVQLPVDSLVERYRSNPTDLGVLPVSHTRIYDILLHVRDSGSGYEFWKGHYINPLVQVLMRVPKEDIVFLQQGVAAAAPHYRYYTMNKSITTIPTASHRYPDGGAMHNLARKLSMRIEGGKGNIDSIAAACDAERDRKRKPHTHEWRFPCDRDAGDGRPL